MGWVSLGSLTLGYNWASFPIEAIGSETFRVIHHSRDIAMGYAIIAPYFVNEGRSPGRKIYPGNDPYIFDIPIPQRLLNAGFAVRTMQAKLSVRARLLTNWELELQIYQ